MLSHHCVSICPVRGKRVRRARSSAVNWAPLRPSDTWLKWTRSFSPLSPSLFQLGSDLGGGIGGSPAVSAIPFFSPISKAAQSSGFLNTTSPIMCWKMLKSLKMFENGQLQPTHTGPDLCCFESSCCLGFPKSSQGQSCWLYLLSSSFSELLVWAPALTLAVPRSLCNCFGSWKAKDAYLLLYLQSLFCCNSNPAPPQACLNSVLFSSRKTPRKVFPGHQGEVMWAFLLRVVSAELCLPPAAFSVPVLCGCPSA